MLEKKKDWHAWLYLALPILFLSVFTFFPLIKTFFIAFDPGYNPVQDAFSFNLGFGSFVKVLGHADFKSVLFNTLILVFVSVPLSTVLALLMSVGLNSIKFLNKIFQTIFFMPYVTNTIAIGMVFAVIFNVQTGLFNSFWKLMGGTQKNWINQTWNSLTATYGRKMFVLQFYTIWNGLAFKILIFMGGLQNIGKQYYDAAKVDGTRKGRVFTKITVPLLSPTIAYILITSFIGAFKSYDSVVGIFGTAWAETKDIQTVVGYIYNQIQGTADNYSLGAAAAVILFAIIMVFTAINLFISNRRVHY